MIGGADGTSPAIAAAARHTICFGVQTWPHKLVRVLPDWELPESAPLCALYPAALANDIRVNALVDFLAANIVPALAR